MGEFGRLNFEIQIIKHFQIIHGNPQPSSLCLIFFNLKFELGRVKFEKLKLAHVSGNKDLLRSKKVVDTAAPITMEDRDPQEGVPKISRDDTAIDLLDIHLISLVEKTCIRLGGAPPRRDSNSDLSQVRGTLSASVEQEVDETQTLSSLSREGRIPPWYTLGMDAGECCDQASLVI